MKDKYKVLHLEDVYTDAELVKNELTENGLDFDYLVMDSEIDFVKALHDFKPDIILSDHSLPGFNSFEALRILKENKLHIPFIVITATMTEVLAMSIVRQGADDYIMKDRLKRLPHAVINTIEKFRFEKERKRFIDEVHEKDALSKELMNQLTEKMLLATRVGGIGIWEYLFEEDKLIADNMMLQHYGLTAATFHENYADIIQCIHTDDKVRVKGEFLNTLARHSDINTEYRVRWRDQSVHFIKVVAVVQRDNAGNPSRLIGTTQDITHNKEAELVIRDSEARLRHALNDFEKIMNSSLDVICTINDEGKFVNVSSASKSVWGYIPQELIGKKYIDLVFKDDVDNTNRVAAEIMKGVPVTFFENRYRKKNGSLAPIIWSAFWDDDDHLMYCIAKDATEKQAVSKIIEDERQRYADLFMKASAFICILKGPAHIFQMANPDYEKIIGKNNFIGKPVREVLPEISSQGFFEILDAVYKTGETFIGNEVIIKLNKQGELVEHYINFSYQAYRNIKNEIEGIFVFGTDTTEQVLARKKIEESEKQYRQIVETAQEGIWIIDINNQTTFVNKKMCEILEYNEDEMIGRTLLSFKDAEEQVLTLQQIARRRQGLNETHESRFITKSGRNIWTSVSTNPVLNAEGNYQGALSMMTDITAKRQEEQHRKLLESVITNTTDSVLITEAEPFDGTGPKIVYVNEAFTKMTGYRPEDVIGKTPRILQGADSDRKELSRLKDAMKKWEPCEITLINYKKNGEQFWINLSVSPVANENGRFTHWIAIERDVSERKLSQIHLNELNETLRKHAKELSMSNAELEQFAYVASHDLQEPLRMVTSYLTQLENKYGTLIDEKGKKYIHFAVDGARRMRQIILDLLEFSKVSKTEDNLRLIDLNELVIELTVLFAKHIEEKKAIITADKLPKMYAFMSPLRHIFQNLVSNALKYSRNDITPCIHISATELKNHWQIKVSDNGIGIREEYFHKIFIIFQRLHNKDEFSGTGIGLAITKKIVETHGGKIWLESEEGQGSTFYFTLLKQNIFETPMVDF